MIVPLPVFFDFAEQADRARKGQGPRKKPDEEIATVTIFLYLSLDHVTKAKFETFKLNKQTTLKLWQ